MKPFRLSVGVVFAAAASLALQDASADITLASAFRETHTEAASVGPIATGGNSTASGGTFADVPTSVGSPVSLGTFVANAAQNSTIPSMTGLSLDGAGSASGAATVPSLGYGIIRSDSVFDVTFTVDAPTLYDYVASASYSEIPPFGPGGATVVLGNMTTNFSYSILLKTDGFPGSNSTSFSLTLSPGNVYRIYAAAQTTAIGGRGDLYNGMSFTPPQTSSANATWSFSLTPAIAVPEASAMAVVALAGTLAAGGRRLVRRQK